MPPNREAFFLSHYGVRNMTITEVHGSLANTVMLYFIFLALWGYARFLTKKGVDSSYWGALVIAEVLIFLQAVLGTYMWVIGLRPARIWHLLYGIVILMVIPGLYLYTNGRGERSEMLLYGTMSLIGWGLALRAISTGMFDIVE
jgi:hypothetical protein